MSTLDDLIVLERLKRVRRFAAGYAHGADPGYARKRVDGDLASDPTWRAGFEAGRHSSEEDLDDWEKTFLRPVLARMRDPERYKDVGPSIQVIDRNGRIAKHRFEEPRDEPSGLGPCWLCMRELEDKVHIRVRR